MSKLAKALTAAAGNAGGGALYVEDVFSTYLYEGNSSTQTITNGIDLDGEGGLVWLKIRPVATSHVLVDTERGASSAIFSDSTDSEQTGYPYVTSFNSDGFTLGNMSATNDSSYNYASWTFRKAEKFFDVVTYTGDATAGRAVAHNLGSVPACIIVKRTDSTSPWIVYHTSIGNDKILQLDDSAGTQPYDNWYSTDPTSSVFTINSYGSMNASGGSYVAYLFASDAGGFGDDESIIKCGSFDGAANTEVNLGFEPQWIMFKNTTSASNWQIVDSMRGMPVGSDDRQLMANLSNAESDNGLTTITATGFTWLPSAASNTYIYIAIRRPMKTPESGTEVFNIGTLGANRDNSSTSAYYAGFPVDMALKKVPVDASANNFVSTRMLGTTDLKTNSTNAERTGETEETFDSNTHWNSAAGTSSTSYSWMFKRATGFFDVVAYTGDGTTNRSIAHNLGVTPELIIYKSRSDGTRSWIVWQKDLNSEYVSNDFYLKLESTNGVAGSNFWDGPPTSSTFQLSGDASDNEINGNGQTYIAYLFATLDGVSKVGSYTGTGADLNVDCGFSAGARFILIKRTDSTGDWYTYDSVRGISAGNDPYLLLNTTAAEVTGTDYIDPLSSGFTVTSTAPAALNASGGTYIFLAIA
jgi:hypothetical protein